MNDGNRVFPVDELFFHHSTGPDFNTESELAIQDWFSDTGKGRGYTDASGNVMRSFHEHPSRPGQETYAMAQFALRQNLNNRNNGYDGWELIELVKDFWNSVTWSVGNWGHNQRSISIEVCGNYLGKTLPDIALILVMDWWRPHDALLAGQTTIWAHQWVFATACPGLIVTEMERAVDILNNPDKYKTIADSFDPQPAPAPAPTPAPVPAPPAVKYTVVEIKPVQMFAQVLTDLVNLDTGKPIKPFAKGQDFTIKGQTTVDGVGYWLTEYAVDHKQPNGLRVSDLAITPPPAPAPTPAPAAPTFGQKYMIEPISPPMTHYAKASGVELKSLDTGKATGTQTYVQGEEFIAVASAIGKDGREYYISSKALSEATPIGVIVSDFVTVKPTTEPTADQRQDGILASLRLFFVALQQAVASLLNNWKG